MPFTFSEIIVLFFTYSVIGWIWETIYCSIKDHHYDYRGFLFGPYCPVYGFAVTTILICTYRMPVSPRMGTSFVEARRMM